MEFGNKPSAFPANTQLKAQGLLKKQGPCLCNQRPIIIFNTTLYNLLKNQLPSRNLARNPTQGATGLGLSPI
jgi:hypothetical protein